VCVCGLGGIHSHTRILKLTTRLRLLPKLRMNEFSPPRHRYAIMVQVEPVSRTLVTTYYPWLWYLLSNTVSSIDVYFNSQAWDSYTVLKSVLNGSKLSRNNLHRAACHLHLPQHNEYHQWLVQMQITCYYTA